MHTSPRQYAAARLQTEVLGALGKHWDRPAQGGTVALGQLTRVWLRAEQVRDVVMLRAHQISGPALRWLVELATGERLRLWMITPRPLPEVEQVLSQVAGARVRTIDPAHAIESLACPDGARCRCEDPNLPAPGASGPAAATSEITVATARRVRLLYDVEAAALATAAIILGRPDPRVLATARLEVATDAASVVTAQGKTLAVPEHAQALLRGWAGWPLLRRAWADDVAATYWTLRLEDADRHTGLSLLDPVLPQLPHVAWHERQDPGAAELAWLTRSRWPFR